MIEAGPPYATLFWREGYIESKISIHGAFEQFGNWLELRRGKEYSDEAAAALVGSPLAAIATLPFHAEAVITAAHPLIGGGLKFYLRTGSAEIAPTTSGSSGRKIASFRRDNCAHS